MKGDAGIVDTLTQQIANAKTEAVQAAEADATSKANDAQAEAVKKAKAEATQYTDGKLADYYTKAEIDESQRVQNERIKKLEAARPTSGAGASYDFAQAEAVKTGETIKLADGTVKDIYRLCVEKKTNNTAFYITKAHPIMSENIITITGMAYSPNINTTLENAFSIVFNDTDGFVLIPKLTDKDFNKVKIIIDFFI